MLACLLFAGRDAWRNQPQILRLRGFATSLRMTLLFWCDHSERRLNFRAIVQDDTSTPA
jgi:hypothetical protein